MKRRMLVFESPGVVVVREAPFPECGAGELLVSSICSAVSPGTELLLYRGQMPPEMMGDATIGALQADGYPLPFGYAVVGRVTAVGDGVSPDWLHRLVFSFQPHQSHFIARPETLFPLPPGMDPQTAVFLPNMETALSFVMDARPVIGERVAVWGQGVVGLLTTMLLAQFPLRELIGFDPVAMRRVRSLAAGADAALNPLELSRESWLQPRFNSTAPEAGFDLALEISGAPVALDQAVSFLGYHGRLVIGSWYGRKPVYLDLGGRFHRSHIQLISSQVSNLAAQWRGRWDKARRLQFAWEMLLRHQPQQLITHQWPLEKAAAAFRLLDTKPEEALQILFTYEEDP